jgi:hypothetical protein
MMVNMLLRSNLGTLMLVFALGMSGPSLAGELRYPVVDTGQDSCYDDWRLANAKEMQSLVDYNRAPGVTDSAAIDPVFDTTRLENGEYPYFWTSTTHLDGRKPGEAAVYIAFGRALGYMRARGRTGSYRLLDVHGAGAQRSDPKTGDPGDFPHGRGPQGDDIRIFNFVRLVRDVEPVASKEE